MKKFEIISCILLNHNQIKLKINRKKKIKQTLQKIHKLLQNKQYILERLMNH